MARYGDEEFVIILPKTDLAGAQITAEKVRESMANNAIHHELSPTVDFVKMSFDLYIMSDAKIEMYSDEVIRWLIESADMELYQAKEKAVIRFVH